VNGSKFVALHILVVAMLVYAVSNLLSFIGLIHLNPLNALISVAVATYGAVRIIAAVFGPNLRRLERELDGRGGENTSRKEKTCIICGSAMHDSTECPFNRQHE